LPTQNLKRKQNDEVWFESGALGVSPPELKLYEDVTLTRELKSANFDLVDRGSVGEKTIWLRNMSDRQILNVQLEAHPEPDPDYARKKNAVGPMYLELEPKTISSLKPKEAVALKLTWRVAEDEPTTIRCASISGTAQFTGE